MAARSQDKSPALPAPAAAAAATEADRPPCTEVAELDDKFRKMTDRLLTEGSTFEEVMETVAQRGGPQLTLAAVRDYFRHNLRLQMRRVRYQKRASDALKGAIGTNTPEGDLAEAAFITGFMSLGRSGSETNLKDTERARLERENLRLRQSVLKLKNARERKERDLLSARTAYEKARGRKLIKEVRELHREATKPDAERQLPPETIQKIREIYGLVKPQPPFELSQREAQDPKLDE
jgi:hypothetical protein